MLLRQALKNQITSTQPLFGSELRYIIGINMVFSARVTDNCVEGYRYDPDFEPTSWPLGLRWRWVLDHHDTDDVPEEDYEDKLQALYNSRPVRRVQPIHWSSSEAALQSPRSSSKIAWVPFVLLGQVSVVSWTSVHPWFSVRLTGLLLRFSPTAGLTALAWN